MHGKSCAAPSSWIRPTGCAADYETSRRRDREFLFDVPDAYDLRLEGNDKVDGSEYKKFHVDSKLVPSEP